MESNEELLKMINGKFIFLKDGRVIERSQFMQYLAKRYMSAGTHPGFIAVDAQYEVTFLRFLLQAIVNMLPDVAEKLNDELFDNCRKQAEGYLVSRFPKTDEEKNDS